MLPDVIQQQWRGMKTDLATLHIHIEEMHPSSRKG